MQADNDKVPENLPSPDEDIVHERDETVVLEPQKRPPYKMNVTWVNDGRRY